MLVWVKVQFRFPSPIYSSPHVASPGSLFDKTPNKFALKRPQRSKIDMGFEFFGNVASALYPSFCSDPAWQAPHYFCVCVYVRISLSLSIYISTYKCVYIYISTYKSVSIYIYIYTYRVCLALKALDGQHQGAKVLTA